MNKTFILLWGIRRAGNHVLHNWLGRQFEPPTRHVLNVEYNAMAALEAKGKRIAINYNTLLICFESHPLATVLSAERGGYFEKSLGCYDRIRNVIILRDPWNLFASRLSCGLKRLQHPANHLWVEYAKAFIDKPYDAEYVNYNEFITNKAYRLALSEKLGGTFDDSSMDEVLGCGGGSSFDKQIYDGRAGEMDVFGRWKVWQAVPGYRKLFTPEIEELAGKLFEKWKPKKDW